MKNNMVFMLFFSTLFAQAMEKENMHRVEKENTWSIVAHGTKITLHKGDMPQYYANDKGKEDIAICTGRVQHSGALGMSCPRFPLGKYYEMGGIFIESYKDEDGKWRHPCLRMWNSPAPARDVIFARKGIYLLCMEEPWLYKKNDESLYYEWQYVRNGPKEEYYGNEALEQYREDASLCYKILLNNVKFLYGDVRSIAISAFGRGFKYYKGFFISQEDISLIAIKSILEYIKSAPNMYDNLELFLENDSDVDLCKKLLLDNLGVTKNFSLFLFAHKEPKSIVASLPRELINYIAKLI